MPTCLHLSPSDPTRVEIGTHQLTASLQEDGLGPSAATRRRFRYSDGPQRGSNPWGRRGRRRCGLCRLWRQRCEYTHLDEPCTLCAEKGRECTREDKVWGPRHQPSVDDEIPEGLSNDDLYIERYNAFWPDNHCSPRIFISKLSVHVGIPLYKPYLEFARSSNLFKNAILVFMSYQDTNSERFETWEYVGAYYQGVRESIRSNSMLEIVYSDYIMAVYTLVTSRDVSTILVWCTQFCRCLDQLSRVNVTGEELLWIETLWQGVLSSLYYILRDQWHHCRLWGQNSKELKVLLGLGNWAIGDCLFAPRYEMTTEVICQKIKSLSINMQFYLEQFLFEQSVGLDTSDTQFELRFVLNRILLLLVDEGSVEDTATSLLYNFAILIKGMLEENEHNTETRVIAAANRINELCHAGVNRLIMKRSLFWAGLVLSRAHSPASVSIQSKLQQCGDCQWSDCEAPMDDRDILAAAAQRNSFAEIWTIPLLFPYVQTLAPWFFGINLVRFEYTGRGRSLEIIGSP